MQQLARHKPRQLLRLFSLQSCFAFGEWNQIGWQLFDFGVFVCFESGQPEFFCGRSCGSFCREQISLLASGFGDGDRIPE